MKKLLALFLTVLMIVLSAPLAFAAEEKEIIDSYVHTDNGCTFNWVLYDDYTLVLDGEGKITHHNIVTEYPVKKIIITDTLTGLNENIFQYLRLRQIEAFEVSDTHPTYSTVDGVLFNKDKTVIHHFPDGKTDPYEIPESVKEIRPCSFAFSKLTSITIPENVEYIGWQAFYESDLREVFFETKNNSLFISYQSFAYCKNLSNTNLRADRLYCVDATSFYETSFMLNEENWEDGVLYLNDILLAVDNEKIEKEYTIKDGTKCIADNAQFVRNTEENDNDGFVKVTIPESVNNIGYDSIMDYVSLPSNLFRVGTSTYIGALIGEFMLNNKELIEEYSEWYEKYDSEITYEALMEWYEKSYNGEMTIDSLKELPEELIYFVAAYDKIVLSVSPVYPFELYWFDNKYEAFVDHTINWSTGMVIEMTTTPITSDGFILPETLEFISKYTEFSDKYIEMSINYYELFVLEQYEWYDKNTFSKEKSLTFLNRDVKIFDSPDTIWKGYTICGYVGSTAYEYALKYNRKFVDIENCTHSELAYLYKLDATCKREGYSGDVYCQYCGEFLCEGEKTPTSGCSFSEWKIEVKTTCTVDGTEKSACTVCGVEETRVYEKAPGHKLTTIITEYPDCNSFGEECTYCENCSYKSWVVLPKLEHEDNNRDGKCDLCGADLTENCSCNCHKDGIMSIIYKIMRFFWKLFGMKKVCDCGVAHY